MVFRRNCATLTKLRTTHLQVFEKSILLPCFRTKGQFCVPDKISTGIVLTSVILSGADSARRPEEVSVVYDTKWRSAFKALHSQVYMEFCLVRLASLDSNWSYFWSECSWLPLYWSLHLSGLISVFVLGHFSNKEKSILNVYWCHCRVRRKCCVKILH